MNYKKEIVKCKKQKNNNNENKETIGYKEYQIDVPNFILELRRMMNRTINDFVYDMGWDNEKYYSKIVNGYYCNKTHQKKHSNPTINYIFGGINHALNNNESYRNKRKEIEILIWKYFIVIN